MGGGGGGGERGAEVSRGLLETIHDVIVGSESD